MIDPNYEDWEREEIWGIEAQAWREPVEELERKGLIVPPERIFNFDSLDGNMPIKDACKRLGLNWHEFANALLRHETRKRC